MNIDTRYNPFTAAAVLAWSELSSDRAITFYRRSAIAVAINTLEFTLDGLEGWYMATMLMIQLGQMARQVYGQWQESQQPVQSSMLLCPAACAGYLPEVSSAPRPVLVTPASEALKTRNFLDLSAIADILPERNLNDLTIRELKALARDRKIPRYSKLTKSGLIAALSD